MSVVGEFEHLAYEKAIIDYLIEYLSEKCLEVDGEPGSTVICDEVAFRDRIVPQSELVSYISKLRGESAIIQKELRGFRLHRLPEPDRHPVLNPKKLTDGREERTEEPSAQHGKQETEESGKVSKPKKTRKRGSRNRSKRATQGAD